MKSVFISSTFKDMQAERDLLHETVFPRLRRVMARYGEDIQELDLRWGVDTANMSEEESGHQVLRVCIDAIDRCKPFFIVLLGERYGWIPGVKIVESVRDERISRYYEDEMSITNLEILYGALAEEQLLERCIFCFRNPSLNEEIEAEYRGIFDVESKRHRERLERLKRAIREKENATVLDYHASWDREHHCVTGLEEFGEAVYGLLTDMIRTEYAGQQPGSEEEQWIREMQQTKERYLSSYVHRPLDELQILERCVEYVKDWQESRNKRKRIFVKGEAGTGKSALMAACAKALEGKEEGKWCKCYSILYFAGNPGCQDKSTLKRVLCYRLEEILGQSHEEKEGSLEDRLKALDEKIGENTGEKRVVCFLDAADQLSGAGEDGYLDVLSLCPHLYYVISALPSFPFERSIAGSGMEFVTVVPGAFTTEKVRQMIAVTVSRRGKKLDEVVSESVLGKKGSGNPLYLSMILQRLFMMDGAEFAEAEAMAPGMEGLHQYMMKLLSRMPEDLNGMVRYLLEETGRHFDAEDFFLTAALLAESREGLTEQELEGIFAGEGIPFSQIHFQQIVSYLYDGFSQRQDGKWNFAHRLFQEAVRETFQEECCKAKGFLVSYARRDAEFFRREGYEYLLKGKCPEGVRILEEAGSEEEREKLDGLVGSLLQNSREHRTYFIEMAKENSSSGKLVGFWNWFWAESYGEDARLAVFHILDCFLEDQKCPPSDRLACCRRYIFECKKSREEAQSAKYQQLAEQLVEQMEENEKPFARASFFAICADSEEAFERREKAQELRRQAWDILGEVVRTKDPVLREKAVVMRGGLADRIISTDDWMGKERKPDMAQEALAEMKACGCDKAESRYAENSVRLLGLLVNIYTEGTYFDIDKAVAYGEEGLALARDCVKRNPSVNHLCALSMILADYTWTRKKEYRYPYYEESMLVRRRVLERENIPENQRAFARAALIYAKNADYAVESGIEGLPGDLREKADRYWEESFALYRKLMPGGMNPESISVYRFGLFARADVMAERRRYEEAIQYVKTGLSLLPEEQTGEGNGNEYIDLVDQVHAGWLLAEIYMDIFQEEKAYLEAEKALSYVKLMEQRYPSKIKSQLARIYGRLADISYRKHDMEQTSAMLDMAEAAYEAFAGEDSYLRERAKLAYIRGRICYAKGDYAGALECCQRALWMEGQSGAKRLQIEEQLIREKMLILQADLMLAKGDYADAKVQWNGLWNSFKDYQKKVRELKEGETDYLKAMLDVLTGYICRRFGDTLRLGGLVSPTGQERVDFKDGKLVMVDLNTGGELEYCEAYLCYRPWIGTYEAMERFGRETFESFREMFASLTDARRFWVARVYTDALGDSGKDLFPWEKDFFQELLIRYDMSGTDSLKFFQLALDCVDLGTAKAILPENREGLGQACFVAERLEEALQWMENVEAMPDGTAKITRCLARYQLAKQGGKAIPFDKKQLERFLEKLSGQEGSGITSCQIRVCHELLTEVTQGKERAEHIYRVFGFQWRYTLVIGHYHRQHLRMLDQVIQMVEDGWYTPKQVSALWEELSWTAKVLEEEGSLSALEEKVRVWVALIRIFAPRLRETEEKSVREGLRRLWKMLMEEEGAWEIGCKLMTQEDIVCLLWRWLDTAGGGLDDWKFRNRLGFELYKRTGERKWVTEFWQENIEYLEREEAGRWYDTIVENVEQSAGVVRKLAEYLWEVLKWLITEDEAERDFWIEMAIEEFRRDVLPDGLSKETLTEAADCLGAYRPQYGEEILQMAGNWENYRLEQFTAKVENYFRKK